MRWCSWTSPPAPSTCSGRHRRSTSTSASSRSLARSSSRPRMARPRSPTSIRPGTADATGPHDEAPPLIVKSHGGPTAEAMPSFDLETQFWTSRGFARRGRELRREHRLRACVPAATERQLGHRRHRRLHQRRAMAGSAGRGRRGPAPDHRGERRRLHDALRPHDARRRSPQAPATSGWRISRRSSGAARTSSSPATCSRWSGPYPEEAERYRARSPIHFTDGISCPMLLLQGSEDRVVPPAQAEIMVEALDEEGAAVRLHPVRRGTARVPEGGVDAERAGGGALLLRAGARVRARRRADAPDREPLERSRGSRGAGLRPTPRAGEGAHLSATSGSQPQGERAVSPRVRWSGKPCGAQPPIIDIDRSGWTKSGWLIRCPDHFDQNPA